MKRKPIPWTRSELAGRTFGTICQKRRALALGAPQHSDGGIDQPVISRVLPAPKAIKSV